MLVNGLHTTVTPPGSPASALTMRVRAEEQLLSEFTRVLAERGPDSPPVVMSGEQLVFAFSGLPGEGRDRAD